MPVSTGPAIRAVVRVINQNSCGTGSICGRDAAGRLYILTNAHVAGTKIGRIVTVEIESLGMRKIKAKVIRAAYSNNVSADWALLLTEDVITGIEPVYLSKNAPPKEYSLYTKGFPRCQPHGGTDITQQRTMANGVLLWLPNAIGGQSGSGVWGDDDHIQYALLTWSMRPSWTWYGAGQLTAEIYKQNRAFTLGLPLSGYPKMPDMIELPADQDLNYDRTGLTDPVVEEGFHGEVVEAGIVDYPIWYENQSPPPPPTDPGNPDQWRNRGIELLRKRIEADQAELAAWEKAVSDPVDPTVHGALDINFGL
jgi:hypothetical protein